MDMTRNLDKLKKNNKSSDVKESFDVESFKINIETNVHSTKNPFCIDSLLSKNEVDNYNSDFTEVSSEKEFYDICNKNNLTSPENNLRYIDIIYKKCVLCLLTYSLLYFLTI